MVADDAAFDVALGESRPFVIMEFVDSETSSLGIVVGDRDGTRNCPRLNITTKGNQLDMRLLWIPPS